MSGPEDLEGFYREGYQRSPEEAERMGRWRALGARAKADHVVELCERAGLTPFSIVEIGCGDGALLAELSSRAFGEELAGFELSEPAVEIARARGIPGVVRLDAYDGARVPAEDATWDLGVLSHVLEHVHEPADVLREAGRVCRAWWSRCRWRRTGRRAAARSARARTRSGICTRSTRAAVRAFVEQAGMRVVADVADPLTYEAHAFFATGAGARAKAAAKAGVRRGLWTVRAAGRGARVHRALRGALHGLAGASRSVR